MRKTSVLLLFAELADVGGILGLLAAEAMGDQTVDAHGETVDQRGEEQEQKDLLETMESEDCTPSLTQAIQLKQASLQRTLNMDMIFAILRQPKANQQEKIVLKVNDIRRFFPQNYTTIQMTNDIMKGLELLRKQRARSKDAR